MSSSEGESNKPRCSLNKNKLKPNNEIVNTSVRHKVSAKYPTSYFENEIGFFKEFLLKNVLLRAYYLGFD